ncbi:MAG TPA: branched-chain amino acid transaminase [Haliangiales bacterium]|nr:branched-chain amino acid transaminase [Haliangiales bacterium]
MALIKKLDWVWVDGKLVAWDDAKEHVLCHTLHYGLGAFEGIRAYRRADGRTAVFRLAEHIDRLFDTCHIITLDIPYSREAIRDACVTVVRENKLPAAYLRPIVYLGYGAMGLGSFEPPVRTVVACYEWGAYLGEEGLRRGIRARVSSFRRGAIDSTMTKGKICGQYVNSILAKRDALKAGYDEAIMLDAQGYVTEATGENVFIVRKGVVYTAPTSSSILAGITRDSILRIARDLGIDVREHVYTRDEMWCADEVFMCGTAAEITPVREVDDRRIGSGEPGPITRRVQETYFDVVKGAKARYPEWLTYV